jgi:hypothetical protein
LSSTFRCCDEAPLARALLDALAEGEPVSVAQLSQALDRDEAELAAILDGWPNVHRDGRARVVACGGLSITPTEHRFEVAGRRLYAWCAWDTLILPSLLGREARSFCSHVHVLAGQGAAQAWLAENGGAFTLSLKDAVGLGRLATEQLSEGGGDGNPRC